MVSALSFFWCCSGADTSIWEDAVGDEQATVVGTDGIQASRVGKREDKSGDDSPASVESVGSTEGGDASPTEQESSPKVVVEKPEKKEVVAEPVSSGTFDVRLDMRVGERLGALLDILDLKTLRVVHVREEGRLKKHNDDAPEHKRVHPGFFIVSVNGKSGDVEVMVDELQRTRIWKLKVARIYTFSVTLPKRGPLCLDLHFEPEGNCVVIRRIGDGAVKEYNNNLPEGAELIKVGDRIYAVNNEVSTASQLLAKIRASGEEVALQLGRPAL